MSIKFKNPKDYKIIKTQVKNTICRYGIELKIVNVYLGVIEKYEGKKITKRIATDLQKLLPKYTVYYDTSYGMYHVNVWGSDIEYDNRIRMLIGHDSNPCVNVEKIKEFNLCYTLNEGRIEKLKEGLKKLRGFTNKYNALLEKAQKLDNEACEFELEYSLGFDITFEK